jgi:hypothetical protein
MSEQKVAPARFVSLVGERTETKRRGRKAKASFVLTHEVKAYSNNVLIHGIASEVLAIFAHAQGNAPRTMRWTQAREKRELSLTNFAGKNGTAFSFEDLLHGLDWQECSQTTEWQSFRRDQLVTVSGMPLIDCDIYVLIKLIEIIKYLSAQGIDRINLYALVKKLRRPQYESVNSTREMLQIFTSLGLLSRTSLSVWEHNGVRLKRTPLFDVRPREGERGGFSDLALLYRSNGFLDVSVRLKRVLEGFDAVFSEHALWALLAPQKGYHPEEAFLAESASKIGNVFSVPHPDKVDIALPAIRLFGLLSAYEPYVSTRRGPENSEKSFVLVRSMAAQAVASVVGRASWLGREKSEFLKKVLTPLADVYADFVVDSGRISMVYKFLYARNEFVDERLIRHFHEKILSN